MRSDKGVMLVLLCAAVVQGCGGGGDDGDGGDGSSDFRTSSSSTIDAFSVEGTAAAQAGVVPISAASGGGFVLDWTAAASTDPYAVTAYVSLDDTLDDGDVDFFTQNCGSNDASYACDNEGRIECVFGSDNRIVCDGDPDSTSLQNWLVMLPQPATIILRVCDGSFSDCVTAAAAVQFQ